MPKKKAIKTFAIRTKKKESPHHARTYTYIYTYIQHLSHTCVYLYSTYIYIYIYIYIYTEHQSHIMRIRQFPEHIKHGVTENKNYKTKNLFGLFPEPIKHGVLEIPLARGRKDNNNGFAAHLLALRHLYSHEA